MANGRCRIHGGTSLSGADHPNFKTGLYTKYASVSIQNKLNEFAASDPLDLTHELALVRALLADYLSRFVDGVPMDAFSIDGMTVLTDRIRKLVETISKMKNETALTAAEVKYLQARAIDVALQYFPNDPEKQRRFIVDLFGVTPDDSIRNPELIGSGAP